MNINQDELKQFVEQLLKKLQQDWAAYNPSDTDPKMFQILQQMRTIILDLERNNCDAYKPLLMRDKIQKYQEDIKIKIQKTTDIVEQANESMIKLQDTMETKLNELKETDGNEINIYDDIYIKLNNIQTCFKNQLNKLTGMTELYKQVKLNQTKISKTQPPNDAHEEKESSIIIKKKQRFSNELSDPAIIMQAKTKKDYHLRRIAPPVSNQQLFKRYDDLEFNKTDYFREDPHSKNTSCFSNYNIEVKPSSGQIVLPNGHCFNIGLGGFAVFNMSVDQKIAVCHGTQLTNKQFQKAIEKKKVFSGNIIVFTTLFQQIPFITVFTLGYAYQLPDEKILDCSQHWKNNLCTPAAINDFHNITDIITKKPKKQNCKIFYYDSIIFYLATDTINEGDELWTDYGELYDLAKFTQDLQSFSSSSSSQH